MFVASTPSLFFFEREFVTFSLERKRTPEGSDVPKKSRKTPSLSRNFGICLPPFHYLLVTFSLERKSNQKVQGQPDRSARLSGSRSAKALG
jgi:hypothetical protein